MNGFWIIAWNSFRELLRQPVYLALLSGTLVIIGLLANVSYFGFGEEARLVKTTSLSIVLLTGLLSAVLSASASVAQEIRTGTALSLLAKPVGRPTFLLAKYAGIAAALLVQTYAGLLAALLSSRMAFEAHGSPDWLAIGIFFGAILAAFAIGLASNFLTHRPFLADATLALTVTVTLAFLVINLFDRHGTRQSFGTGVDWRMVPVGALVTLALLVLGGLALACSARLALLPTLLVCSIFFALGMLSDYLLGDAIQRGSWLASTVHTLLPNWQHFWLADALGTDRAVPWAYVTKAAAYAAGYLGITLAIGLMLFEDRELH